MFRGAVLSDQGSAGTVDVDGGTVRLRGDLGATRLFRIQAKGPNFVPRHEYNGNICGPVRLGGAVSVLISAAGLMADLRKGTYGD